MLTIGFESRRPDSNREPAAYKSISFRSRHCVLASAVMTEGIELDPVKCRYPEGDPR